MKRIIAILLTISMLLACTALAETNPGGTPPRALSGGAV